MPFNSWLDLALFICNTPTLIFSSLTSCRVAVKFSLVASRWSVQTLSFSNRDQIIIPAWIMIHPARCQPGRQFALPLIPKETTTWTQSRTTAAHLSLQSHLPLMDDGGRKHAEGKRRHECWLLISVFVCLYRYLVQTASLLSAFL